MTTDPEIMAHPQISSREDWLLARKELLAQEKTLTKEYDRINAMRRRLPMVEVEENYVFTGATGTKSLLELFGDKAQLIVYHFMFGPDWEEGCPGCTSYVDALGDLSTLGRRNTAMVLVSRAPYEKLAAYKKKKGWTMAWYSSHGTDFNYDFGVTLDPDRGAAEYNYKTGEELVAAVGEISKPTELPGLSVFFRVGDKVYHTYSTFARGSEALTDSYRLLDVTPYGRQEDFEDSPPGWPQKPTYG